MHIGLFRPMAESGFQFRGARSKGNNIKKNNPKLLININNKITNKQ